MTGTPRNADLDGRGVVGQVAALGILEVHEQAILDHGAERAGVGGDGGLDDAVGVGDQLLDLEALAGVVEPRAGRRCAGRATS